MEAIKTSSSSSSSSASSSSSSSSSLISSSQRNNINSLSSRINRSSPSINLTVNSDDDDYAILPPSPPINRTPYSRLKGKARSRSSSRARITLDTTSDGPTSMIQERQPANHHYNYHSGRDFSSFDCYQIDNSRKMVNRNGSDASNGRESNVIRKNRENIYEILTSKKFMDTQKTIGSCNIGQKEENNYLKQQQQQHHQKKSQLNRHDLDDIIIDPDNLTNDALLEREWNKLVNGTCGSIVRPITPNGKKLNQPSTIRLPSSSSSSLSTAITTTTTTAIPTVKVKASNEVNHLACDDYFDKTKREKEIETNKAKIINIINNMNNHINHNNNNYHNNNNINGDDKSSIPGTRFKEILKLYENLGKSMLDSEDKPINRKDQELKVNGGINNCADDVNNHLKSTILQLDSVCQNRLKGIEECQRKIEELRKELRTKEDLNKSLQAETDSLAGQLEEAREGWKSEKEKRIKEEEQFKRITSKLYARLDELNRELQESHINYDYLEMAYNRLKVDVQGLQETHSAEINLMKDRLNDLTNKLVISEKSLKNAKSHIGKLEARRDSRRRGSSLRSSRGSSEGVNGLKDDTNNCIPKDFQHKLQELEVKIARIQGILLANEHQSPDEGLPDIETHSFPGSLNDHKKILELSNPINHKLPTILTATSSPTSLPMKVEKASLSSTPSSQINSSQTIQSNENNLITTR
uniref:Uncharacterized protein n=2 Tax=Tetranychus urticae TaxID=32264 RepID=T1KX84_TETUR